MKNFLCARCGACCCQPGYVYLETGEADRMARLLGLELYNFTDEYCAVLDRRHLVLRRHANEKCLFLEAGGCRVYGERPKQCRDFPKIWSTANSLTYCEGLKKA